MPGSTSSRRRSTYRDGYAGGGYDEYGYQNRRHDGIAYGRVSETVVPPVPVGPSAEERRAYLSDTHTRTWVRDGIIAKDLDEAIAIVEAYAGAREMPISSDAAERLPDSEDGAGIVMIALGEIMLQRGTDVFLDRLRATIRSTLQERGSFMQGWDYDGPGAFHKCTLRIVPEGKRLVVRISAVGRDPEPRLAKAFGLRQRFLRAEHHVTWASPGEDYAIPFVQFQRTARIAGATTLPDATSVLHDLVTPKGDDCSGSAVLFENGIIRMVVAFDDVRVPGNWRLRDWARARNLERVPAEWEPHLVEGEDGPVIAGRAMHWREWPNPWAAGAYIRIEAVDPTDPEHEAACIAASNDVGRLWAGLPGAWRDSQK